MNFSDIWNTPGYFYALSYAFATLMVVFFQRPAASAWKRWLCRAGVFAFLLGFMHVTRGAKGLRFVAAMAVILGAIYFSVFDTVRDWVKAGFLSVKAFIYGEYAASLCWQIYYYLALRCAPLQTPQGLIASMLLIDAAIFTLLYLMERTLYRGDLEPTITVKDLLIELLAASAVFVVSNLGYLDQNSPFSGSYARDIFAIRTLVDLSGVIMIYALHRQLIEVQLRFEKDALHSIMEMQYQTYRLSRESIDIVNQKYHDLKHQIVLLRAETDPGKAGEALDRMAREIQIYETQNQTGNRVLDAILANKSLCCQNRGIELKVIANGQLLSFMEDMDICALFGNMLDNAIEGVARVAAPERRLIRLYVDGERQFLRIRVENYCEAPVRFRDGLPVTTKGDERYHGFGMKSMQRTVAKYGGSMVAACDDNWFALKILIPIKG